MACRLDLVVVGYLLHDVLDIDGVQSAALGGPAAYTSIAAKKLGMKTGIVSKIGEDFRYEDALDGIDREGIALQKYTTTFYNTYRCGVRTQRVEHVGQQIEPEDIPERYLKARAISFGPVIDELNPEIFEFVHSNSDSLIALDPQGLLRKEHNGKVLQKNNFDFGILEYIDILKLSEEDIARNSVLNKLIEECAKRKKLLVVTRAERGAIIYADKIIQIPSFPANVIDPTGAGDVWIAGFLKNYLETNDLQEAGLFASAAAAFCVEGIGQSGLADERKVRMRICCTKDVSALAK